MSDFLSTLDIRYVGKNDEEKWELLQPFVYQSDVAGITITVPAGYITDLASVPRFPLAYWLTGGKAKLASVPHDFLCETKLVSREMADKVFLEAAELAGVPGWRRSVMWTAVRAYGALSGKDTPEQKPIKPEDFYIG
jgi:hypothetical protein